VCARAASNATTAGGLRAAATPLQTAYAFAAAALPAAADWPLVDAPHDALFSLNGTFCEACGDPGHSYRTRTVAWYRKTFALPKEWAPATGGGATFVRFEGVMHFAQVWLNGAYLVSHSSSYGDFLVRLDNASAAVFGGENVLAVRADASYGSELWYGGGGIHRNVQLVHLDGPLAFVEHGVWVPPELAVGAAGAVASAPPV
jgi:beta-galactosidase